MVFLRNIKLVILAVLLNGCYSNDDSYYGATIYVSTKDAFTFPVNNEFTVGDTLIIEQRFSRYLEEEGYAELLDVYESTESEEFGFNFQMEQYSEFSQDYNWLFLDSQFILGKRLNAGYQADAIALTLNEEEDAYESRMGIVLSESGRFRLNLQNVTFFSGNDFYYDETVSIGVEHLFTHEEDALWEFTVIDPTN